ncbi:MAG: hypothetical protein HUJ75_06140, partial [Parasporobacterium sp.]|nr:hypothetical protein [Parasporobacterium sp.]
MKTSPMKKLITVMALGLVLIITGCCAGAPKPEVTGGTSYQLTFKDCLPVAGEKVSSWAPCPSSEGLPCTAT